MKHLGFSYDMARCIGCRACQLACKEAHTLPAGIYFRRVTDGPSAFFYSGACNHCKDPACVAVCPVGAMYVNEEGLVQHNDALCMGCERCVFACPYGEAVIHPASGLAVKCDGCREARSQGLPPACAGACPTGALRFEDLEEQIKAEAFACTPGPAGADKTAEKNADKIVDKAAEERGRTIYGGPAFLPDPLETLPSLLVKHVPEAMQRESCKAMEQYLAAGSEACEKDQRTSESAGAEALSETSFPEKGSEQSEEFSEQKETGALDADLLIIGSGIAAISAAISAADRMAAEAAESKAVSPAKILICGEEPGVPYVRPLLSKGLLKGFSMGRYEALPDETAKQKNISFVSGRKAVHIDAKAHCVQFSDGSSIGYRACLIASGARAFVPPIPGTDEADIITVRNAADLECMRRKTLKAHRAVVIGGGFIGLEIAWQLRELGLEMTVLEGLPKLLGRLVDLSTSELLKAQMENRGMKVLTGVSIARFRKEGKDSIVEFADGSSVAADLIVLSTGVRANTELALDSGAECGRGIRVNERFETSLPDVFAVGDCAENAGGTLRQSWTDAVLSGRAAGESIAARLLGGNHVCSSEADMRAESMMVNVAGTHVLSVGRITDTQDADRMVLCWTDPADPFRINRTDPIRGTDGKDREEQRARGVFFFEAQKLAGACVIGSLRQIRWIQDSVTAGCGKEDFLRQAAERGMQNEV